MLNIAICDDNSVQTELIQSEIGRSLDGHLSYNLNLFHDGKLFEHEILLRNCPYDIVILNIELGNFSKSGIALAREINCLNPAAQIIFVSQSLEYAPDVYACRHTYFISRDRIPELMESALNISLENLAIGSAEECLYIKVRKSQYKIPQNKILYMERNIRETTIHTYTSEFRTSEKIDSILKRLPDYFISCHRSYAINLKMAVAIHRNSAIFSNGRSIPIGRTHYEDVKKAFKSIGDGV